MGKTDKPFPQLVSLPDPPTNQPTNQGGFTKDFWTHQPSTSRFTKVLSLDHLGGACRVGGTLLGAQKEGFLHGALPRVTLHTSLFFWFQGFYTENFDRNHLEDRRYQIYQEFCMFWRVWLFLYMADIHRPKENTTIFEIEIRPVEVASSGTVSLHFHGISYSAKRKFPCNELMGVAGRLVLWTPPVQSIHRHCPHGGSP